MFTKPNDAGHGVDQVKKGAQEIAEASKEKVQGLAAGASDRARDVKEQAQKGAEQVGGQAADAADRVKGAAEGAAHNSEQPVKTENGTGIVSKAVGAVTYGAGVVKDATLTVVGSSMGAVKTVAGKVEDVALANKSGA